MSLSPPRWTRDEFDRGVARGVERFREQRLSEAREDYSSHFHEARSEVEDLLELTTDLAALEQVGGEVMLDGGYLPALRYLAAPPVSDDDLETLSGVSERHYAEADKWPLVVDTIMTYIDSHRFPWIVDSHEPTEQERYAAVISTAAQMAAQRVLTARRNEAKADQEALVKEALRSANFKEVRAREMRSSRSFPRLGEFCGESKVGEKKADIVVGLRDERLLAIECKVSNSKVNSTKRIAEALNKARGWLLDFGTRGIVPCAVIAGVYNVGNLIDAQERGLTIWWSHDVATMNIAAMIEWIDLAGSC
jgi:hypothetical protein